MRPRYEQRFEEPRRIAVADWELLEGVEALLGPYGGPEQGPYGGPGQGPYGAYQPAESGGVITITNGVATVADLRALVEERGASPRLFRVLKWNDDPSISVHVYIRNGYCEAFVSASTEDEASADRMITQLAELVRQAADRYAAAHPESARNQAKEES